LPWPAGVAHRINTIGNSYNCSDHDLVTASDSTAYNADYYAIDFEFTLDQPIAAVAAGTVLIAENKGDGYGVKVVIDHGGGLSSTYAHLDYPAPGIQPGSGVSQGQTIGYADNTGFSFGDHLHFHLMLGLAAFKLEKMSNVPITGQTFGQYGGCTGQASAYWTSAATAWRAWTDFGALYDRQGPFAISHSDERPDHTHMLWRDGFGDIWIRNWTGSVWTGWQNLSSGPSDPLFNGSFAISNRYDRIYIAAISNSTVWFKYWDGFGWSSWQDISLGSPITGDISISYGDGPTFRVDIVGVASNAAWLKWWDGAWHGWQDLSGGSPITGPVAVADRDGLIHVVGMASGKAWLKWWNGTGWWGWQDLVSPLNGPLAIDDKGAIQGNTGSTHYGVHIAALASTHAWVRCWEIDCNQTGWTDIGGPSYTPISMANVLAQVHVTGNSLSLPTQSNPGHIRHKQKS